MLIASAQPMASFLYSATSSAPLSTAYPSLLQGYGRIQLSSLLHFGSPCTTSPITLFALGSARPGAPHFAQLLATGGQRAYTFTAPGSLRAVRVVLCYTDAPGSVSAAASMVNQLLLTVTGSDGSSYRPYALGQPAGYGDGYSTAQVVDVAPPQGAADTTYTVRVSAVSLAVAPQAFALVIRGENAYLPNGASSAVDRSYTRGGGEGQEGEVSRGARAGIVVLVLLLSCLAGVVWYVRRVSIAKRRELLWAEEDAQPRGSL